MKLMQREGGPVLTHVYTVYANIAKPEDEHPHIVGRSFDATSPDEAMTMFERLGFDYEWAEVQDAQGNQLAVYDIYSQEDEQEAAIAADERRIEEGQARWAETGTSRKW